MILIQYRYKTDTCYMLVRLDTVFYLGYMVMSVED